MGELTRMNCICTFAECIEYLFEILQGGILVYAEDQLNAFKRAFVNFQQQKDIKAALFSSVVYASGQVRTVSGV
jgi:hypothetical protein